MHSALLSGESRERTSPRGQRPKNARGSVCDLDDGRFHPAIAYVQWPTRQSPLDLSVKSCKLAPLLGDNRNGKSRNLEHAEKARVVGQAT